MHASVMPCLLHRSLHSRSEEARCAVSLKQAAQVVLGDAVAPLGQDGDDGDEVSAAIKSGNIEQTVRPEHSAHDHAHAAAVSCAERRRRGCDSAACYKKLASSSDALARYQHNPCWEELTP